MTVLYPVAANWELFTEQIGVPKYEVDTISASIGPVPNKATKCLNEAMSWWLANDPCPSRKKIAEVLRGNVVPYRELAKHFEADSQGGISGIPWLERGTVVAVNIGITSVWGWVLGDDT